ncbi:hypothetical protein FQN54_001986 [Arachnomyces sp. PD_36]|nr:hypothetical protein FQN54_001986 [Arachnomyces sp. PD_36]
MPTIRAENGRQVKVTMGDILRGSRRIKVEKAEIAARKRAKSLDKSLDTSTPPKPTSPPREVQVRSPQSGAKTTSKPANGKLAKPTPAPKSTSQPELKEHSRASTWTAEQDARLRRLKRADAGWTAISAVMGKSIPSLKTRWTELEHEKAQNDRMSGGLPPDHSGGWTPDLDAYLKGLKESDLSWKVIAATMGRTVGEVKARWQILSILEREERESKEAMAMDGAQMSRQNKRQVSFASPLIMPENVSVPYYCFNWRILRDAFSIRMLSSLDLANVDGLQESPQNGKSRRPVLFVDEDFSVDDIVLLNRIASRYEEEKWLRITSRFFDKTGKRITTQQAKSRVAEVE